MNKNVDFENDYDTGDVGRESIHPVKTGEPAVAETFNRPLEALRRRSETLRIEANDQRWLRDADRAFHGWLEDGANITWSATDNKLQSSGSLSIASFINPGESRDPEFEFSGSKYPSRRSFLDYEFSTGAYIRLLSTEYQHQGSGTYTFRVIEDPEISGMLLTLEGSDVDNLSNQPGKRHIVVRYEPGSAPTLQAVVDAINTQSPVDSVVNAVAVEDAAQEVEETDLLHFVPGLDSVYHKIPAGVLGSVELHDGDCLAIDYDSTEHRRQSVEDSDNHILTTSNLINLSEHPEKASSCIPIARRIGDRLLWFNGKVFLEDITYYGFNSTTIYNVTFGEHGEFELTEDTEYTHKLEHRHMGTGDALLSVDFLEALQDLYIQGAVQVDGEVSTHSRFVLGELNGEGEAIGGPEAASYLSSNGEAEVTLEAVDTAGNYQASSLTVTGVLSVHDKLDVSGDANLASNLTVQGNVSVEGALQVDTTVEAANNIITMGDLTVEGQSLLGGASVNSDFFVGGDSTFLNEATFSSSDGNVYIRGNGIFADEGMGSNTLPTLVPVLRGLETGGTIKSTGTGQSLDGRAGIWSRVSGSEHLHHDLVPRVAIEVLNYIPTVIHENTPSGAPGVTDQQGIHVQAVPDNQSTADDLATFVGLPFPREDFISAEVVLPNAGSLSISEMKQRSLSVIMCDFGSVNNDPPYEDIFTYQDNGLVTLWVTRQDDAPYNESPGSFNLIIYLKNSDNIWPE